MEQNLYLGSLLKLFRMSMHLLFPIRSVFSHTKQSSFLSCKTKQEYFHFVLKQYGLINVKDPFFALLKERRPGVGRSSCAGGVRQQPCVPAHGAQRNIWRDGSHRGSSCWFWWELGEALPLCLVGSPDKMLVSSPTWQSGCWSMFFTHI